MWKQRKSWMRVTKREREREKKKKPKRKVNINNYEIWLPNINVIETASALSKTSAEES